MPVASVYPSYIAKAEKNGRTRAEVDEIFRWLTGHSQASLEAEFAKWLERARSFSMTAIAQYRETRDQLGRGRYSLWTGDIGLAIYLWDCLTAKPQFPTIDVF